MEEKIFNLLEKMYNDMNEMRKDIKSNNDQISDMRKDIKNNNDQISDMRKDIKNNNDQISDMRKDIKNNNDQISDMRKDIKNNNDQISDMRKDIKNNNDQIMEVQKNIARLENNLIKNTLIIENDITQKINALFDGYVQNTEMFHRIEAKVDHLTNIVEKHEVEIKVIKGAK